MASPDWQTYLLAARKAHAVDSSTLELQLKKEYQSFTKEEFFSNSSKKQETIVTTKIQVDLLIEYALESPKASTLEQDCMLMCTC
jgi:hypothetical protein